MEQRNSSIEIYRSPEGNIELNVKLENDTVWLTQSQMAELFAVDRTSVTRHIRNIYKSQELDEKSTCAKNAQVRFEGKRQIIRDIPYYNLDMIISVGYRVNSKNATSFRRWATSILKQYIIKGYAINQKRLDNYNELKEVVRLMSRAITLQDQVSEGEYNGLFNVISDYVYALDTLDKYDYQTLLIDKTTQAEPFHATYENAMEAINALKEKFGGSKWFANEKDDSFKSSIGQIYSTFVFLQFWNMFNAKGFETQHSVFTCLGGCREFFLILAAIGVGQVLIVEFGGEVFRTEPLSWMQWAEVIGFTSLLAVSGEIIRAIHRKRKQLR